jgi:membrane-associated phospholipid phosphatase
MEAASPAGFRAAARERKSLNWDAQLVAFFNQGLAHPLLDGLMVAVSVGAIPLSVIGSLFLLLAGKRREGSALLITFLFSTLLAVGIQLLVMRPRPAGIRVVQPTSAFPSFPSGHAAAAFGGATLVSLV